MRIKFTAQRPSERDDERRRQKKQKSTAFNLRNKYGGSQYRNVKRGVKEKRKAQQKPGGLGGEGQQRRGLGSQKGSLLLMKEKKKSKRKAPSRLLDAVSNPISVWSGSAARLPGTGSQWRRAGAATPLTSNLHPPGQAWEQGGRVEGRQYASNV